MAEARERGLVAVEAKTIGPGPMQAEICGISLALEPGRACYVPLGHRTGEGDGDIFADSRNWRPGPDPASRCAWRC